MNAVFDTTIVIDALNGIAGAANEFDRYERCMISRAVWLEVLIGVEDGEEEVLVRDFLEAFEIVELTREVAEEALFLRRHYRVKLPDAIIWASARTQNSLLVTRDSKDFPADDPGVRIPYQV